MLRIRLAILFYFAETLVVTLADGVNGAEKDVGKSTFVTGSLNPSWDKVFTVNWNKKKDHVKSTNIIL